MTHSWRDAAPALPARYASSLYTPALSTGAFVIVVILTLFLTGTSLRWVHALVRRLSSRLRQLRTEAVVVASSEPEAGLKNALSLLRDMTAADSYVPLWLLACFGAAVGTLGFGFILVLIGPLSAAAVLALGALFAFVSSYLALSFRTAHVTGLRDDATLRTLRDIVGEPRGCANIWEEVEKTVC